MPRSFLIKKHGKEEYLGQENSRVPSDSDMSGDTVDADRVTEMDTATKDSYTEDDEYLDVESLDQEDVLIKGSEVLQRQTGVLMEGRPCPTRPPSGHSEDQLQPEDLSQKGPSGSSELSRKVRLGPAGQTSPQGGVVPVPRQAHREKTSPDAGHVLRVPGRKLLLSPYEFTSTPPPLCRPAVGESPLNFKYSDPRFWMAGLPGLPAYIPGMHPLFPVSPTTLSTQLMSQQRMDSPSALQIRASLSAFRSPQDQVTPYPFPETAGGSLVARSSCLPFQPPYPYSHSSRPHPSPSADGLALPRTVFTSFVRGPGQRERATIMDRKENRTPSPPLNWLLDAPYNLSTKSSSAPSSPGKAAAPQKRPNDPPRYQCEACNKSYATFSGLSKHKQFHCETQIKKEFTCKYCDKTYTSLGALKMHIRTHTLPCKCQICGKAFSRPWLLQGHVRTHTGEKPFTCPHCGRAFADRSNLRAHLQTHSDVKKYSCKTCAKTFSRMSLLLKHEDGSCPGLRPSISVIPVSSTSTPDLRHPGMIEL